MYASERLTGTSNVALTALSNLKFQIKLANPGLGAKKRERGSHVGTRPHLGLHVTLIVTHVNNVMKAMQTREPNNSPTDMGYPCCRF
jgi:hypothetical protein